MSAPTPIKVILLGVGNVGRCLISQIHSYRSFHASKYGLNFQFVGLADSSTGLYSQSWTDETVQSIIDNKQKTGKLTNDQSTSQSAADLVKHYADKTTIVVDCSASESVVSCLIEALQKGAAITMANKKPFCCPLSQFQTFMQPNNFSRIRYESTVGAGTPFITTVQRLMAAGDFPTRIAGTFSGTLGFLCSGLESGRKYSDVVHEAFKLGYTEPEPRDDLGGVDVARKACILARSLGWSIEFSDVKIEPLFPDSMKSLSVKDFLAALPSLDAEFTSRHEAAMKEDKVLRYVAEITNNKCSVGLQAVPKNSPLGRLQGTENLVEFYTGIYAAKPLVVQGAGAGGEVTAAGVLADCVELAQVLLGNRH